MDFELTLVSLAQIQIADHTFKITTSNDTTDLAMSISAVGLLQPPVLIEKRQGYGVVCGFRRIAACKSLDLERIPARILPAEHSRSSCAMMAVADNASQRPLNVVEQSRGYALIQRHADEKRSWMELARCVGLPVSQSAMNRLLPVVQMPEALQKGILNGSIAIPVALAIHRLPQDDAAVLVRLFDQLNTGLNIQREMLEMISEITLRDNTPIAELIEQADIAAILQNDEAPKPLKVQELRRLLKRKRYPELSKSEARFQRMLRAVKLSPNVQLQHPPFFEGKTYRVTVTIESQQQMKALLSDLDKIASHPHLLPADRF